LNREIDEEFQSHIEEAIEQGRNPAEAQRAFGSMLRQREESRDVRLVAWLDSVRADAIFAWRQILKKKAASAAAILSLGLAIGACTSAFRAVRIDPIAALRSELQRRYSTRFRSRRYFSKAVRPAAVNWSSVRGILPWKVFSIEM
jgi:hypothetical protein